MPKEPERRALAEKRVAPLVAFAFLPSGDHAPPRRVVHRDPTAVERAEAGGAQLTAIDQGEGQPIGKDGAKFFHDVECQSGPPRTVAVQVPDLGVEPLRFQCGADVVRKQGIEEGQQCVIGSSGGRRLRPANEICGSPPAIKNGNAAQ